MTHMVRIKSITLIMIRLRTTNPKANNLTTRTRTNKKSTHIKTDMSITIMRSMVKTVSTQTSLIMSRTSITTMKLTPNLTLNNSTTIKLTT